MARLHPNLQPYVPSESDPFDNVKAAHLLNRAGFGGSSAEIKKIMEMGPQRAVAWLMDFPEAGADEQSETDVPDLSVIDGFPKTFRDLQRQLVGKTQDERQQIRQKYMRANAEANSAVVNWWLQRMSGAPAPLQEKLTLFWSGHFTTSAKDERAALLIWSQNELLRRFAAGNFREFVRQIARDPAMLDYLNNNENRKAHPNENYARELMELFTLGIGNYTEDDIKQAARAFTGWGHDGEEFIYRRFDHDDGLKVFFGHRGNFDGDDIIDMILMSPACAPYISSRLFKFFAYDESDVTLYQSLGQLLKENRWEMRPVIQTILTSKAFYSDAAIGTQIKSPIQLIVGTVKALDVKLPVETRQLTNAMQQMGQVPLNPPNVKGWPGGRMWINTSTLFVRYNTAVWLAGGGGGDRPIDRFANRARFVPQSGSTPEATVDFWIERLIQRPVDAEQRKVLVDAMNGETDSNTVKHMVQLILSMPEYQLC